MEMSDHTRAAVQECEIHWDGIAVGDPKESVGASYCSLCRRFNGDDCARDPDRAGGVEHCPIKRATGQEGCRGTPYYRARDEWYSNERSMVARGQMADFIHSLSNLPDILEGYHD